MMHIPEKPLRQIRSFVRREGRMTPKQQQALEQLWPHYGIEWENITLDKIAPDNMPVVLEIGFGMGGSLIEMAKKEPEKFFIGVEVYRPGIGHLLSAIKENQLENIRVCFGDAVDLLNQSIPDQFLDRVQIYFSDPWPKKRHHKRRLIQSPFVKLITQKLKKGGVLHSATDWENYAEQMLEVCTGNPDLVNLAGEGQFSERPKYRPLTKFEKRGARLGHGVWDLLFQKN